MMEDDYGKSLEEWHRRRRVEYGGGGESPYHRKIPRLPTLRLTTTPLGQQEKFTLGEELVKRIEMGEMPEVAFVSVLKKGLRHPGTTKARLTAYLLRDIEKAQEEGRI